MKRFYRFIFLLSLVSLQLCIDQSFAETTVSGQVVIPASEMGWQPRLSGMKVRVEGTEIESVVNPYTGDFTLLDVPAGTITLLLVENGQDAFTQASKRVEISVGSTPVTGVSFDLAYHWLELAGYPSKWGQTGYTGEWNAHFVSADVGFMLFRVRGTGIDPERVELYRTEDGGITWEEIGHWEYGAAVYPAFTQRLFYFADQDHGVVEALVDTNADPDVVWYSVAGVLYTDDGGETWSFRDFPNPPEVGVSGVIAIHLFEKITDSHWIAAGTNAGTSGYDVIWESINSGYDWTIKTYWQQNNGSCTGLGANAAGKAIAFFTPYGASERRICLRGSSGSWTVTPDDAIVTNSGYGPADVPMVGNMAWVSNSIYGTSPSGLYRSANAGGSWIKVADVLMQYMDFATAYKGFALAGGPVYVTYDGGETWLYQSAGGGICCHGNDIWAFDVDSAVWHEAGVGDPGGGSQLFTYVEPWEADFEVLPGLALEHTRGDAGETEVSMASYQLVNHGPVPLLLDSVQIRTSGTGSVPGDVASIDLWLDENANGLVDAADTWLDQGSYTPATGRVMFNIQDIVLQQLLPVYLLVTYDFNAELTVGGTFGCSLRASGITARAQDTLSSVDATAPPSYPLSGRLVTTRRVSKAALTVIPLLLLDDM
jgi:hypothetical protein